MYPNNWSTIGWNTVYTKQQVECEILVSEYEAKQWLCVLIIPG